MEKGLILVMTLQFQQLIKSLRLESYSTPLMTPLASHLLAITDECIYIDLVIPHIGPISLTILGLAVAVSLEEPEYSGYTSCSTAVHVSSCF